MNYQQEHLREFWATTVKQKELQNYVIHFSSLNSFWIAEIFLSPCLPNNSRNFPTGSWGLITKKKNFCDLDPHDFDLPSIQTNPGSACVSRLK